MLAGTATGGDSLSGNRQPSLDAALAARLKDEQDTSDIRMAFDAIDSDHSGSISADELTALCALLGHALTEAETLVMLKKLDIDGDGTVTVEEFAEWWNAQDKGADFVGGMNMDRLKGLMPSMAAIIYNLFEDPSWFKAMGKKGVPFEMLAYIIAVVINLMIIVSTFAFCFESVKSTSPDPHVNPEDWQYWESVWWTIEVVCVAMFTAELVIRIAAAASTNRLRECLSDPMTWIDAVAIFPFYIKFAVEDFIDLRFIRVIRLARILAALPSPKYKNVGRVVTDIFVHSAAPLFVPLFFMALTCVILSSGAYYAELAVSYSCELPNGTKFENWNSMSTSPGNEGCQTPTGCMCPGVKWFVGLDGVERPSQTFSSIPDAFWWCVVTFSTVGYGDVMPRTPLGMIIGMAAMVVGIFFLAMPLAITGSAFVVSYKKLEARAAVIQAEQRRRDQEVIKVAEEEDDESFQNLVQCRANISAAKWAVGQLQIDAARTWTSDNIRLVEDQNFDYAAVLDKLTDADSALKALAEKAELLFLDRSKVEAQTDLGGDEVREQGDVEAGKSGKRSTASSSSESLLRSPGGEGEGGSGQAAKKTSPRKVQKEAVKKQGREVGGTPNPMKTKMKKVKGASKGVKIHNPMNPALADDDNELE